jgi:hypothetical protein
MLSGIMRGCISTMGLLSPESELIMNTVHPADMRIKLLCLRNKVVVPTAEQLERIPLRFRDFTGTDKLERLNMGIMFMQWLGKQEVV